MPIRIRCPKCQATSAAPDEAAGRVVACPACKQPLSLPGHASIPKASSATAPVPSRPPLPPTTPKARAPQPRAPVPKDAVQAGPPLPRGRAPAPLIVVPQLRRSRTTRRRMPVPKWVWVAAGSGLAVLLVASLIYTSLRTPEEDVRAQANAPKAGKEPRVAAAGIKK